MGAPLRFRKAFEMHSQMPIQSVLSPVKTEAPPSVVRDVTRAGRGVIVFTAPIFRAESVSSSKNGWTRSL